MSVVMTATFFKCINFDKDTWKNKKTVIYLSIK